MGQKRYLGSPCGLADKPPNRDSPLRNAGPHSRTANNRTKIRNLFDSTLSEERNLPAEYCSNQKPEIMTEKVNVQMNHAGRFESRGSADCGSMNPKELLLCAAAKCAGLTAAAIMKRERMTPKSFEISVAGELSTETLQAESVFTCFHVVYNVECCSEEECAKASRALELTHDKYCGLIQMLSRIAPVTRQIAVINTQPVKV